MPNVISARGKHRWSGWPGAYCLDCGKEDATEMAVAADGDVGSVHHRYTHLPHKAKDCEGCAFDYEPCVPGQPKRTTRI